MNSKGINDKSATISFLNQLNADPLNPDLCRQAGIEIVPAEIPAPARVYVQGIGHVSRRYAALRRQLVVLVKRLGPFELSWYIIDENTGRVQIIISGLNKSVIAAQKIEVANRVREIYPGIRLLNSKTRGYSIWRCYFSDGNFNTYACGFEFDMPIEIGAK